MGAPVSLALAPRTRPSVPSYLLPISAKAPMLPMCPARMAAYHGNAADDGLSEMLSDLEDKLVAIVVDVESVENLGQRLALELHCVVVRLPTLVDCGGRERRRTIDDGTNDLVDLAITNTGSAGESLPCGRSEERSRANCAESWARSPADGGDATVVGEKTSQLLHQSLVSSTWNELNWVSPSPPPEKKCW